jgi:SAM-dependent methyltransferase
VDNQIVKTAEAVKSPNGRLDELLASRAGIQLDIGCGATKQGPDYIGMDLRDLPGVDIVHDINMYPWPLPDDSVIRAVCSHLVEHIPPHPPDPRLRGLIHLLADKDVITYDEAKDWLGEWQDSTPRFIRFMDEVWRVLQPDGQFAIVCPHGYSPGQLQDPSHCNASNEATWAYFDPLEQHTGGQLYRIYRPKPWELIHITWAPEANMEVLMRKRRDDYSYYE